VLFWQSVDEQCHLINSCHSIPQPAGPIWRSEGENLLPFIMICIACYSTNQNIICGYFAHYIFWWLPHMNITAICKTDFYGQ
jgi:hypothetical protein